MENIDNVSAYLSIGLLVALLVWESGAPFFDAFRGEPRRRVIHAGRNLFFTVANAIMISLGFAALWLWAANMAAANRFGILYWLNLSPGAGLIVSLLFFDLWTYWWHRLNHRIPFLWRFHRMHHSDPQMDVTTANRFHLGEIAISSLLRVPLILLIGAPLWHLALYEALMFPVVQFHHANVGLPHWLDRTLRIILVTPAMHKVHHSRWQPETDSNYTSMLSIWDRLFGTFRMREDLHSIRLGLDGFDDHEHQSLKGLLKTPLNQKSAKSQ
ncbi:MAG: sterol desaturase family protein [Verrucomicrobiae bacterium]|nr:sterol desaturase family protein [Verrucomicrobiae bacterium]